MGYTSTILIVDDDAAGRKTLEIMLDSAEYRLVFAANGRDALDRARALVPDLVLLDVMMPGMDGFEVCRRLRATPQLAEVPVLLVTALDDRESRLRGIEAGADDFITKPCDSVELRARVQAITRLNRYRRLVAQRARFEWVVERSDDGYLIIDADACINYANPEARRCLGLPADDRVIEVGFLELAGRNYRCEPQDAWQDWPQAADTTPQTARYLVRPETQTARELWLQVDLLGLPLEPNGGRLLRLRDVTEQMTLQRDIWKFHSTIFHKLRTPLVGMMGGMETLVNRADQLGPGEVARIAGISLEAAQRLHSDLEDILQYLSTPQLAHRGAGVRLTQIPAIVDSVCAEMPLVSVTVIIEETLRPVRLTISRRAFELVLLELLDNAQKFHPHSTPTVSVDVDRADERTICLRVADDGMTLSPAQIAHVWMPYYQGEKYLTGQVHGMGLGLPMIASLMYSIGGTARIYNRESGPGVVVELLLPQAL